MDLKRRIFQRAPSADPRDRLLAIDPGHRPPMDGNGNRPARVREAAFDAGPVAQIVVDRRGHLLVWPTSRPRQLFNLAASDLGRLLQDLEISYRPVELRSRIDAAFLSRTARDAQGGRVEPGRAASRACWRSRSCRWLRRRRRRCSAPASPSSTSRVQHQLAGELQRTHQELETAYEELQSTNEELETTNEELQSTVEELETTNEELQSTNEELETMNEELQSTNEELRSMNDQLQQRSDELRRRQRLPRLHPRQPARGRGGAQRRAQGGDLERQGPGALGAARRRGAGAAAS